MRTALDFNVSGVLDPAEIEFNSLPAHETQFQDAGGNLRTPRLRQGEAFYKRILQTFSYDIYSTARRTHSIYIWNEEMIAPVS